MANAGYLLLGLAANGPTATGAVLFHGVTYGLAAFGALAVSAAIERDAGDDRFEKLAGLFRRSPFLALSLLVFMASLAGLPPLAGFVGKFTLFSAAVAESRTPAHNGLLWLVALAAGMSAVSLFYYLRALKRAIVSADPDVRGAFRITTFHRLAVGVPAILLVLLGLFPSLLLEPITAALHTLLGQR